MFTIIIPLYNKQNSITNTLRSVTNQSIHDFEVLVINDGSTDLSIQKVHEFIQVDQRILLIHKENGGVCTARNLGIEKSNNSFISFLDADDYWEPTYLEEQLRLIHDFPKAAMWGMNFAPVSNGIVEKLYTGLPENYRGYVTDYFTSGRVSDLFCSSSVVVRKEAFNVAGMFDTRIRFSEDLDMWYRIILNFPVAFDARIFVYYDQDTENRAMHKDKPLKEWLPYFVSKYDSYSERNCAFSHYIHTFSAAHLAHYYFSSNGQREDAQIATKQLKYKDIHPKYRLLYRTPYFLGYFIYILLRFKHQIWKKLGFKLRFTKEWNSSNHL